MKKSTDWMNGDFNANQSNGLNEGGWPVKTLIKHLLQHNAEYVLANSYKNCHVRGLHSIALNITGGAMLRLYVHVPGGQLEFRGYLYPTLDDEDLPLAIHAHNRDLTLQCVKGEVCNINAIKHVHGRLANSWEYQSKINTGVSGFKHIGEERLLVSMTGRIEPGYSLHLPAQQLHTVICGSGYASWLVYEGMPDPNYQPISYSNARLDQINPCNLYQRFNSMEEIEELMVGVL